MPAKLLPAELGQRVRSFRKAIDMTQQQLAECMGYKGNDAGAYVSRVESGKTDPRLNTLRRMAKALGLTVSDLLK